MLFPKNSEITLDKESNVLRQSFSADCLPNMSCGMIETNGFYSEYPDNSWLLYSESSESLEDYRLDSMIDRLDPYYEAMHESMTLEDLKSQFNSCNSCGVSWGDNHVSLDCLECGGYSLTRPCPLCDGECKSEWTRDVSMSHSVGKAHWDGECTLSKDDLQSVPSFLAEDILVQGIEELSTSS
ncbi:Protein pinocchio [Armadillidium vulgare]|nr:Protein pinocchio [Armadillidium vulgare]